MRRRNAEYRKQIFRNTAEDGLKKGYCRNGYMTEAVRAITEWALSQNKVSRVEAETDPDNLPSKRILANVGFVPTGEVGEEGPRFVLEKK